MKRYNEYRSIIFTITTALVFSLWEVLSPIVSSSKSSVFLLPLLGFVISLGFYRIVLRIVESITIRFQFVKKIVFGRSYLDGIWVGAYIGSNGKPRYFIEYFEQDFNSFIIRSKCYYEDKKYKGDWKSTNVSIDEDKGELYYTYETTMKDNGFRNMGFAIFTFDRKNKLASPNKLFGFSSDIDSGTMNRAVEEKIQTKKGMTEQELLDKAMEVYQNNINTLLRQ